MSKDILNKRVEDASNKTLSNKITFGDLIKFGIVGVVLELYLKAEIISWFRIQEMFRFQSFHMYGIIGSAVIVGMISVWLINTFNIKTIDGKK